MTKLKRIIARHILPESAARTRRRIRAESALRKLFYQGANPLRHGQDVRAPDTAQIVDDAEYYSITKCRHIRQRYGFT